MWGSLSAAEDSVTARSLTVRAGLTEIFRRISGVRNEMVAHAFPQFGNVGICDHDSPFPSEKGPLLHETTRHARTGVTCSDLTGCFSLLQFKTWILGLPAKTLRHVVGITDPSLTHLAGVHARRGLSSALAKCSWIPPGAGATCFVSPATSSLAEAVK